MSHWSSQGGPPRSRRHSEPEVAPWFSTRALLPPSSSSEKSGAPATAWYALVRAMRPSSPSPWYLSIHCRSGPTLRSNTSRSKGATSSLMGESNAPLPPPGPSEAQQYTWTSHHMWSACEKSATGPQPAWSTASPRWCGMRSGSLSLVGRCIVSERVARSMGLLETATTRPCTVTLKRPGATVAGRGTSDKGACS